MASVRTVWVSALVLLSAGLLAAGLYALSSPATPPADPEPEPAELPYPKPANPLPKQYTPEELARDGGPSPRIIASFLTRRGPTPFQSLLRYDKVPVPIQQMPGWREVVAYLQIHGQEPPPVVFRVDQITESVVNNLGERAHSVISSKSFLHPSDPRTLAYDITITSGGIPQRMVGHLFKRGVMVEVYRGEQLADRNEIALPTKMSILPVEIEFIHLWQPATVKPGDTARWSFFVPEVSGFVLLEAVFKGLEQISHGGQTHQCARYDVKTASTKSREGVFSRQRMWFDMASGIMLRRMDFEEGVDEETEGLVTERVEPEELESLQALEIRAPELPQAPLPYELGKEYFWRVDARGQRLGRVHATFHAQEADKWGPAGLRAEAEVRVETGGSLRREKALTRYDEHGFPVFYKAQGEEAVESQADYVVEALFGEGRVRTHLFRHLHGAAAGSSAMHPETVHPNGTPLSPASAEHDACWLRPVPLSDDEEEKQEEQQERMQDQDVERPIDSGVFVFDHHRIEQLALLASRLPRPPAPKAGEAGEIKYQKVALYTVRRHQAGVLQFAIQAEPPLPDPESGEILAEPDGPTLYLASSVSTLLPCTMLLGPDGRLLQLISRYGTGEVIYTLDDPIMRAREARAREQRGQEGPQLIRPPWF
ncbi:MAG: hypothetical protein HS116_06605 [Planctomycetes bacterium]|nr:hypothetical protein [Planctomycetota bacterium]